MFEPISTEPLYWPEAGTDDPKQANAAKDRFTELKNSANYERILFIRSYLPGKRGWWIEFKQRALEQKEYLLASYPSSVKLTKKLK